MVKLCECGCGKPAPIATRTHRRWDHIKGQPKRFIKGHHTRGANNPNFGGYFTRKHGMAGTPEHYAYCAAKFRCTNPKSKGWPDYGGRGIKFLFTSFEQFLAALGPRPEGKLPNGKALYSLDRFPNNDGNYEPGNVRWATWSEQQSNQRRQKRAA
jgi:hypothetical protein